MATNSKTSRSTVRTSRTDRRVAVRKADGTLRADQVARARKLIRDPHYPPPKVVRSVARVLARHWTAGKEPSNLPAPSGVQPAKASCTT
jgi:hypothetical protein